MNPLASTVPSSTSPHAALIAPVRILIVQDDQQLATALARSLEQQGYTIVGISATGAIAIQQAIALRPDLVLLDLLLPGELDSVAVAAKINQQLRCPILYLTAHVGSAVSQFQSATPPSQKRDPSGHLAKLSEFAALDLAIESALQWHGAGTESPPTGVERPSLPPDLPQLLHWDLLQTEFFQQVCKLIRTEDPTPVTPLTFRSSRLDRPLSDGLPRLYSTEPAPPVPARPRVLRTNYLIPLLCLKLDRLHRIYRKWGQQVGDRVLQGTAERLIASVGSEGQVAYLPPQEFAILWKPIKSRGQVISAARALLQAIAEPLTIDRQTIAVTASLGAAFYPRDGQPLETLLQRSRQTISHLQRQGGNRYEFYHPQHELAPMLQSPLKRDFAAAIDCRTLYLHYQPQVAINTGAVVGVEAGVRWYHPDEGEVGATALLELATATGLLSELGWWQLEAACQQLNAWQVAGLPLLQMSVPLNATLLKQPDLASRLTQRLQATGIAPRSLDLEVDEAHLFNHRALMLQQFRALEAIGVHLTIAQSGTSDSLLKHLQQFPCHSLKLSAAFIRGLHCQVQKSTIAANLIAWAHHHQRTVVAAGVATQGEFNCLKQHQCDIAQGSWFSGFVAAPELVELVNGGKSFPIAQ
jgi:diguanylate cyclase (GGDEF)-like protein